MNTEEQYGKDFFDRMVQGEDHKTFVAIDNLHHLKRNRNQAANLVEAAVGIFDTACITADVDFLMEESRMSRPNTAAITALRKMQICEFGYVKIEDLARRWITIKNPSEADEESIRRTCTTIERILRINAMPHHPWVLIVLLQEATSKTELAAKNGSYGYLYQAVVTCALAKSKIDLDVRSKYVYLAELAFAMYEKKVATFDLYEVKIFHQFHLTKFGIPIDFSEMMHDLDAVGILRVSEGRVSFRDKYSYWFFVSWYLSNNIFDDAHLDVIERLCSELHHEDSANILVFLSHFSNHPAVIKSILASAKSLFSTYPLADLDTKADLKVLNLVGTEEMRLRLPSTDPEVNYRAMLEKKDEHLAERDPAETDGRSVAPKAPEVPTDEFSQIVTQLRAAMRAIDILGQVLRNGVGGITLPEKQEIVKEVYFLARRVNGFVIHDLPNDIPQWMTALNERFHDRHVGDTIAQRLNRIANHIVGSLSFLSYALARRVSHALAHEKLESVFDDVLGVDSSNPSRLYDLSARLDLAKGVPINKTQELYHDLSGNVIGRNAVKSLVGNYLYLHRIDVRSRQELCDKLGIDYDTENLNPDQKKIRSAIPRLTDKAKQKEKEKRKREKREKRRRRRSSR